MTADMLHHHLDLTSANNLLTSHHHHHNHHTHEHALSVTSDQFSSLNLSSVGSSASSAHHSPIMEQYETEDELRELQQMDDEKHNNQATCLAGAKSAREGQLAGHFGQLRVSPLSPATSGLGPSSDYTGSQASLSCSPISPVESPTSGNSDELLLRTSAGAAAAATTRASTGTSKTQITTRSTTSPTTDSASSHSSSPSSNSARGPKSDLTLHLSNHHHHHHANQIHKHHAKSTRHLHPDDCNLQQAQQQQQKTRSFSHTTSFSPLQHLQEQQQQQQNQSGQPEESGQSAGSKGTSPQQLQPAERPRRLSRIENRQSLHDLGYGRIESYFKLQRLGKGTYATVYMGRSRLNNDLVALKEILKEHDEGAPCTAIREVSLLRLLRHNNIVTLHDICHTPKKLTLVFEYVGPDLYAYMKENNHLLSIHNVRLLLFQLLRGIAFCHSRQVLHRDLKPQNLLINTRGELKICDFGLARAKSIPTKSYSNEVVTLWYRPPDVLLGNTDYDHSIDMWGVGCIFYEMASGRTFFPGSSVRQQLYLIFSSLGAPNSNNWPEILTNPEYLTYSFPSFRPEKLAHRVPRLDAEGVSLLQSFLRFKPSERLSAQEAMREPFFASLPEECHKLQERESIFDVPGVYMTLNPGQKIANQHHQLNFHSH